MSFVTKMQKQRRVRQRARQRRWMRNYGKSHHGKKTHRCKTHLLEGEFTCPYEPARNRRSKGWLKRNGLWRGK